MLKQYLNKGISTPLALFIIIVLASIVGAFTLWQYSEIQKKETNLTEVKILDKTTIFEKESTSTQLGENTSTIESISTEEIDTSDWKTYRNKEFGFEIKSPKEWQVNVKELELSSRILITFKERESGTYFGIGVNYPADFPSAEAQCVSSKEIKIAGIETKKTNHWSYAPFSSLRELSPAECREDPSLTNIYARIEKEENVYELVLFCKKKEWKGQEGREKCNHLYDSIVSSFSFFE